MSAQKSNQSRTDNRQGSAADLQRDIDTIKPADIAAAFIPAPAGAPEPDTAPVAVSYTVKDQDKFDAFRRLAGKRIAKLMDQFDVLQNCANRAQYEYSPEQVEKIRTALQTRLDFLMNAFAPSAKHVGKTFEL